MKNIVLILLLLVLVGHIFAQTSFQVNCPVSPQMFGDYTPNDTSLWNETYWYDVRYNSQDLREGPVVLDLPITDTCAIVHIRYLLYLDLNQDSILETVIDSDSLPGYNNVQFGNMIGAGIPRAFDERSVGADEKYGFALYKTTDGANITAKVRWNTQQAPSTYRIPELPYGNHKIKWIVSDTCGNETSCEYTFTVKDAKPPTVTCVNGKTVNLLPTLPVAAQINAVDFFLPNGLPFDNATPSSLLQFGIRRSGIGTGFPINSLNVQFTCADLGTFQPVEVWAIDLAGNADFCETYVSVMDSALLCPNQIQHITTCVNFWKDGSPMLTENSNSPDVSLDSMGCMVANALAFSNYTFTPVLDTDPLNGVNVLDLIRISQHILGIVPISSAYGMLAADANKSGSITAFDIVELKKLIAGVYSSLPNNTSWRFVDADYVFPNPANPFSTIFPENATVTVNQIDTSTHLSFWA